MKTLCCISFIALFISCNTNTVKTKSTQIMFPIQGTWKLLTGTLIDKSGTTVTDYTKSKSFIKIINDTHFAFMGHDFNKGKDSSTAFYSSGGGKYDLHDSNYTEHLEYCNDRQWEGNSFNFKITIANDTLVQRGVEQIDSLGVKRLNIEKYVRIRS